MTGITTVFHLLSAVLLFALIGALVHVQVKRDRLAALLRQCGHESQTRTSAGLAHSYLSELCGILRVPFSCAGGIRNSQNVEPLSGRYILRLYTLFGIARVELVENPRRVVVVHVASFDPSRWAAFGKSAPRVGPGLPIELHWQGSVIPEQRENMS